MEKQYYVKLARTGEVVVKGHNEAMDMINQGEGLVVSTVVSEIDKPVPVKVPEPVVEVKEEEEIKETEPVPEPAEAVVVEEKPHKKRGRKKK
jgi:hypothetical protein